MFYVTDIKPGPMHLQALCLNKIWGLWQKDWFSAKKKKKKKKDLSETFWQLALNDKCVKDDRISILGEFTISDFFLPKQL